MAKVPIGKLVFTSGVNDWVADGEASVVSKGVLDALTRHRNGDWGDVCGEDKDTNNRALGAGERLLSAYTVDDRKIWVITEWDRSATTVLFPEEY